MPDREREDAKHLATLLTASPNLRAKLFAEPTKTVGKQLPDDSYWDYGPDATKTERRRRLAQQTLQEIARRIDEGQLSSSITSDAVFEDFFRPIVGASRNRFNWILWLSIAAFVVGLALIGVGVWFAVDPPVTADANPTVISAVFGGTGAISALGSVYAMTIRGISGATSDHARLQLVLTGFATELGHVRSYAETPQDAAGAPANNLELVRNLNAEIAAAMQQALDLIPSEAER